MKVSLFHAEGAEKMFSRRLLWRGQGGPSGVVQQLWHPGLQRWTVSACPSSDVYKRPPPPRHTTGLHRSCLPEAILKQKAYDAELMYKKIAEASNKVNEW